MIWNKLKFFFDLRGDIASTQEITKRVNAGIRLRGTNLSVLILAIFIASIGLNMNSTAVVAKAAELPEPIIKKLAQDNGIEIA